MSLDRHRADAVFGVVLREYRVAAQFSQERLADATGLDRTYISLLERGLRQPSLPTLLALSRALGVTLTTIASRIELEIGRGETPEDGGRDERPPPPNAAQSVSDAEG